MGTAAAARKKADDDPLHCFPSFLAVGATKAGTGLLGKLVKMHPLVHGPSMSLRFFGKRKVSRTAADYVSHPAFALTKKERRSGHVTFEASPEYGARPGALAEIKQLLPAVKLVFVLREPVARREGKGGFNVTSTCKFSDEMCQRKCPLFEHSTRDDLSSKTMSGN